MPNVSGADEVRAKVQNVGVWWHSIDLGNGIVTPGRKTPKIHQEETEKLQIPDLSGKEVLDIGAWDGFYSFLAERKGARRVVALDHYVWSLDIPAMDAYSEEWRRKGTVPLQWDAIPGLWQPERLPGKRGFDVAHEILGSSVKSVVSDFATMDVDTLGKFDITFYLGVLYHMRDPFHCLGRLAQVTRELAIIETAAIYVAGYEKDPLWEFYEKDELAGDVTNWWAPSPVGLVAMCRAAGFSRAEVLTPVPRGPMDSVVSDYVRVKAQRKLIRYRVIVHAWK